jgi:hypothetical protein
VTDDLDLLAVGKGLRPGELMRAPGVPGVQQAPGRAFGDVTGIDDGGAPVAER